MKGMDNMKKFLMLVPALLLLVTGCGDKKGTITCTLSANNRMDGYETISEYKINYKGDIVESVETVETITAENEEVLDTLKSVVEETYAKADKAYGGYKYEVKKDGKKIISTVTIDYDSMDVDKFAKDTPAIKDYVKDGKFTVEGAKKIYETYGATCKE